MKIGKYTNGNIVKYLKGKKQIFDLGTGPTGSYWWKLIDSDALITGIDLNFFPKKIPVSVKIYKFDASELCNLQNDLVLPRYRNILFKKFVNEKVNWNNKFDIIIANHILEHVTSVEKTIDGLSLILKKGGLVYSGFPDYRFFTDIFYHILFPGGGGHIQKLTDIIVETYFNKYGFKLIEKNVWPDDWKWLKGAYESKKDELIYLNQKDLDYLAEVFVKELTSKKGYNYGWEMVFEKK